MTTVHDSGRAPSSAEPRPYAWRRIAAVVFPCWLALPAGCEKNELEREQGEAPPPIASAKPGACASGGGRVGDHVSRAYFPRQSGEYCVDPHGDTRSYGAEAGGPLDNACLELFNGECELYKGYGLDRVVTLRYVDGSGSPGAVNVNLSRFETASGAYAFFTKRVIADSDPAVAAPKPLEAGTAGAIGTGIAYVQRGKHVAELSYTNELESPDQIRESSGRVLPRLARDVGSRLPGPDALPQAVTVLPEQHRIPLGVAYEFGDLFGVRGAGAGAVGYYREGERRYRIFAAARGDEPAAKDVFKSLLKAEGAAPLKKLPYSALRLTRLSEDARKTTWIIGATGRYVMGVGDEELASGAEDATRLSDDEKQKRLGDLLQQATRPEQSSDAGN